MITTIVMSSWFWPAVILYIVLWALVIRFWQLRKKEYKTRTFVERYHLMYKYPFENDCGYNAMCFLGPIGFLLYALAICIGFFVVLLEEILIIGLTIIVVFFTIIYQVSFKLGKK
ncbi:hypothetical protein K0B04_00020 [Patescibacteria group bacterium]|nr:hypothetical protein [Patescibacteria group bacterium]